MAGSNLSSGNGLDGVLVPNGGPFLTVGTINAGTAVATTQTTLGGMVNTNIYQPSETDLAALLTAASGSTRQVIFAGPTAVPGDYVLGVEVSQGDRGSAERGELNNKASQYEVVPTGYTQLIDGRWVSPTGAILTNASTFGSSVSLGSDVTSGMPLKFYTNHGQTSVDTVTANLNH